MRLALLLAVPGCLLLTGFTSCNPINMIDSNVQAKAQEYFPVADVAHPNRGELQIVTHVGNVSELFTAKVMGQLVRDNRQALSIAMLGGGYSVLTVDFEEGQYAWLTARPEMVACTPKPLQQGQLHLYSLSGDPIGRVVPNPLAVPQVPGFTVPPQ